MRVIGLDVHRNFAQVATLEDGVVKDHGRFVMEREAVLAFADKVLGVCFSPAAFVEGSIAAISAATAAKSLSSVSSSRLFCSAL